MKNAPNFPFGDAGQGLEHLEAPASKPNPTPDVTPPVKVTSVQPRNPDGLGFAKFRHSVEFLNKIKHPDFPHVGAGHHVPMWVTPQLAQKLMLEHGMTGHAIPHPNLDLDNLTK